MKRTKEIIEQHLLQKHQEFITNKERFGVVAGLTLTSGYAAAALMNLYKDLFGEDELQNFIESNIDSQNTNDERDEVVID